MKRFIYTIITFSIILITSSCRDSNKDCISSMMDDGYSYDEAQEACEDARSDFNSRR